MLDEDHIIRVIDFETTGVEPDAHPVEIAAVDYTAGGGFRIVGTTLIKPPVPIPPGASAIHHITDADVAKAQKLDEVLPHYLDVGGGQGVTAFAAHNMKFDKQFFATPLPLICTMKSAQTLYPDAPSYTNWGLLYYLKCRTFSPVIAGASHRAWGDAYVTANILHAMLTSEWTVDDLIEITANPVLLQRMAFGKHRGVDFDNMPMDYLQWIARQTDMDEDVKFTAQHQIEKRLAPMLSPRDPLHAM